MIRLLIAGLMLVVVALIMSLTGRTRPGSSDAWLAQ